MASMIFWMDCRDIVPGPQQQPLVGSESHVSTLIFSPLVLQGYRLQQPLHTRSVRIWAFLNALLTKEQLGGEGIAAALAALLAVCLR